MVAYAAPKSGSDDTRTRFTIGYSFRPAAHESWSSDRVFHAAQALVVGAVAGGILRRLG